MTIVGLWHSCDISNDDDLTRLRDIGGTVDRALDPADAPPDVAGRSFHETTAGWNRKPPPELRKQLKKLGLL